MYRMTNKMGGGADSVGFIVVVFFAIKQLNLKNYHARNSGPKGE